MVSGLWFMVCGTPTSSLQKIPQHQMTWSKLLFRLLAFIYGNSYLNLYSQIELVKNLAKLFLIDKGIEG